MQAQGLPAVHAGAQPLLVVGREVNAIGKYFLGWLLGVPVLERSNAERFTPAAQRAARKKR
jgi:hypothetical protein